MAGSEGPNASSPTQQPPKKYDTTIFLSGPTQSDLQRNAELEKVHTHIFIYKVVNFD